MVISPHEPKKKALLAILITMIVVSAVVISVLILFPSPPPNESAYLETKISPHSITAAKGEQMHMAAYAIFKNDSSDPGENVSTSVSLSITTNWEVGGSVLGTLTRGKTPEWGTYFALKTTAIGTSALILTFMYLDNVTSTKYFDNVTVPVTVTSPIFGSVEINPFQLIAFKGGSENFSATARLTDGTVVNATFEWNLTITLLGTLNSTIGESVRFTAGSQHASGNLTCGAHYLGRYAFTYAHITVW